MTNQMTRTIQDLRNEFEGHVYLKFNDQNEYDGFLRAAEAEGFKFGDRMPTENIGKPWDIISVLDGKKLAFCGSMSHMAYASGAENVHRVDYNKYVSGDEAYII